MDYRDAQPLYLSAGWPAPLPLPARAKSPPPEGFTGRGAPYPDQAQLTAWRNGVGDGNLALRLPEGVLGIDVDAYDSKPGAATLARLEAELGPLPETWVSSARYLPSGIRFFQVPTGRAWRDPGPGMEVIHTGWRYIVAWPSEHPNGNLYRWYLGAHLLDQVPNLTTFPPLPEPWVRRLDAGEALPYVEGNADLSWLDVVAPKQGDWGPCPIMLESASRHLDMIRSGGGRHDAMLRGVSAVIHLAADGHRGVLEAVESLRTAFQQVTTDRNTWGEFDRAVLGALQKEGVSDLVQSPPCRCGAPAPSERSPSSPPEPASVDHSHLYLSVNELANLPAAVPIIDGVLDGNALFAITGRDGVYKSFLAFDWLACLATGTSWLGHEVRQRPVLYVVGEGVYGMHVRSLAWQLHHNKGFANEWLTIRRAPVNLFKGGPGFDDLRERIISTQYGVVLFDTLQRMSSGADLNQSRDASVVIERLDALRRLIPGGSVGFVAHTGKSDIDVRGSSVLEDDVDIVWRLRRPEDAAGVIAKLHKRKDGPDGTEVVLMPRRIEGAGSLVLVQASRQQIRSTDRPTHAYEILQKLDTPSGREGLSATAIAGLLKVSRTAPYPSLDWLHDQGLVRIEKNRGVRQYLATASGLSRLAEVGN